jgi:hypothetical protein
LLRSWNGDRADPRPCCRNPPMHLRPA